MPRKSHAAGSANSHGLTPIGGGGRELAAEAAARELHLRAEMSRQAAAAAQLAEQDAAPAAEAGALDAAAGQVSEGLRRSQPFPELRGMLQLDAARLAAAPSDAAREAAARTAANEAFRQAGLAVRAQGRETLREHGSPRDSARP